jgi:hypothetical protein
MKKFYVRHGRTPAAMQAVLSILGYYRGILAPGTPDLAPITEPGKELSQELLDSIVQDGFDPSWKIKVKQLPQVQMRLRSKRGPNGQATISALTDINCLPDELYNSIVALSKILRSEITAFTLNQLRTKASLVPNAYHSRLAIKRELGGKDRVFAMVDYWTQTFLQPIHYGLGEILRKLPQDCTFDQDKGISSMKSWTLSDQEIHSIDLSSASDRFPITLQCKVMEKLTEDSEFVSHWRNLLVNREFKYKTKFYKWAVGQPLGALSSWPSFALSHHVLVRAAHKRVNAPLEYYLLGDDLVIRNPVVAQVYRTLLGELGITTSDKKGLIGNSCEFAKRLIHAGCEVSPVPVSMIQASTSDIMLLAEMVSKIQSRSSDQATDLRVPSFVDAWCNATKHSRELVQILSTYPVPQMRKWFNGKSDLSFEEDLVTHWAGLQVPMEQVRLAYNLVRTRILLNVISGMLSRSRKDLLIVNTLELPSTPSSVRRVHPIYMAHGLHTEEYEEARQEIRAFFTDREVAGDMKGGSVDSGMLCPSVKLTSVTDLAKGSKKFSRHKGTVVLEIFSLLKEEKSLKLTRAHYPKR